MPLILFCLGENVLKNLELFHLAPYIEVMGMGVMITCANVQNHQLYKDTSFQNYRKV